MATDKDRETNPNRERGTAGPEGTAAEIKGRATVGESGGNYERLLDYEVQDSATDKIGTVHNLWIDHTGQPAFFGVKTGWLGMGKNHVVPVYTAHANHRQRVVRLPYSEDQVKGAPAFDADLDLSEANQKEIYRYYGLQQPSSGNEPQWQTIQEKESATFQLSEEQLKADKREVPAGGMRLRKIEREPAPGDQPAETSFEEQDVFIALRREEPRKEDLEMEGEEKPRFPTKPGAQRGPNERYEPKERGKQR